MIINTEWGAFGDNGCLDFMRTAIDKEIDDVSINPAQHKYTPLRFVSLHVSRGLYDICTILTPDSTHYRSFRRRSTANHLIDTDTGK